MTHFNGKRRQFMQFAAWGAAAAMWPGNLMAQASGQTGKVGSMPSSSFKPDVEIELVAKADQIALKSGATTRVFKYHGKLLQGPADTLRELPGFLGPILNLVRGQKVRIYFYNQLAEPTITHWHGMHVPQKADGHPMHVISTDERYVYEFEVLNPAGTNWYHAHPHEATAAQVYQGLAGLITVRDEAERKLDLPDGEFDLPIVIQDRRFTADNQWRYLEHGRREQILGFLGDTILINGQLDRMIPVKTRAYRLRILNGSNSRIYKLGWEDGTPLTAIGTGSALLAKPETFPYIMLAPAERVELWVDFSGREPGSDLVLYSLEYHGAMPRMGSGVPSGRRGMGMSSRLAQGSRFPLLTFRITEKSSESHQLPTSLVDFRRLSDRDAANPDQPIQIGLSMMRMTPSFNGRTFEMQAAAKEERVPINSIQKIRLFQDEQGMRRGGMRGRGGGESMEGMERMRRDVTRRMGGMMSMAHPIHFHGQPFQVLSRLVGREAGSGYATVQEGLINSGWKDTVLVMPGEEVTIIKPFEDFTGLYLYHCHNLEHEDMGMMRNFLVE